MSTNKKIKSLNARLNSISGSNLWTKGNNKRKTGKLNSKFVCLLIARLFFFSFFTNFLIFVNSWFYLEITILILFKGPSLIFKTRSSNIWLTLLINLIIETNLYMIKGKWIPSSQVVTADESWSSIFLCLLFI
jgi:hypothetical protein